MLLRPDAVECWRHCRASGHVGWILRKHVVTPLRRVHKLFAHFALFGLRSVLRSTRLYFLRGIGSCHSVALISVTCFLCVAFSKRPSQPTGGKPILYCPLSRGMPRCQWPRNEIHVLVFCYAPEAVTLTSCSFSGGCLSTSSNMASVGGCRRKSAEEQCAELRARARQTNLKTQPKRQHEVACTQNELTNNDAITKRGPPMPQREGQWCRRLCERSPETLYWLRDDRTNARARK